MSGFVLLCSIAVGLCAVCAAGDVRVRVKVEPDRDGGTILFALALVVVAVVAAYFAGKLI